MKYLIMILFFASLGMANDRAAETEQQGQTKLATEGINFQEWESEFDNSMQKAKGRVRKCESKSKNCQFEKFQALDPSFDMVH